ncbi:MAG: aminopeptidase [Candidatus Hydrogenedentota bacterium]
MADYLKKFARILIEYSLKIKSKEKVIISGCVEAIPLIEQLYIQVLQKGAYPFLRLVPNNLGELFYQYAKKHHLLYLPEINLFEAKKADAVITIQSSTNTKALTSVNPEKPATYIKTMKPIKDIILKKGRWVLTLYPTQAYAQDAEMSLQEFTEFVYKALFVDKKDPVKAWYDLRDYQEKIIKRLKGADRIRILDDDTDLTLSVKNRIFINSCGLYNMPSGEIFTGPIETSANGYIKFSFPACNLGREIEGVYLEFKEGKVVKESATKNEQFLRTMLDMDKGARYPGEFAFGLNYGITKHIKNILFDEKIGGTIHLALGSSYKETGGKNKSALHWDFIKDLRKKGEVYVNDKLFMKKGKIIQ